MHSDYLCSSCINKVKELMNMTISHNYGIELSYIRHMSTLPCNGDTDEYLFSHGEV